MRFPLPVHEIRSLVMGQHRTLVEQLVELGMRRDDIVAEVLVGLAARQEYDPARMRRADSYVVAVARGILLNVLQKARQPMRCPGGVPEQLGVAVPDGAEGWTSVDAAVVAIDPGAPEDDEVDVGPVTPRVEARGRRIRLPRDVRQQPRTPTNPSSNRPEEPMQATPTPTPVPSPNRAAEALQALREDATALEQEAEALRARLARLEARVAARRAMVEQLEAELLEDAA